jgi:hypothetical protein
MCSSKGGHGSSCDYVYKSPTMTWIICLGCKEPVGWLETTNEELMRRPNEEELKKYV